MAQNIQNNGTSGNNSSASEPPPLVTPPRHGEAIPSFPRLHPQASSLIMLILRVVSRPFQGSNALTFPPPPTTPQATQIVHLPMPMTPPAQMVSCTMSRLPSSS